jgi:hypothetical protein
MTCKKSPARSSEQQVCDVCVVTGSKIANGVLNYIVSKARMVAFACHHGRPKATHLQLDKLAT